MIVVVSHPLSRVGVLTGISHPLSRVGVLAYNEIVTRNSRTDRTGFTCLRIIDYRR